MRLERASLGVARRWASRTGIRRCNHSARGGSQTRVTKRSEVGGQQEAVARKCATTFNVWATRLRRRRVPCPSPPLSYFPSLSIFCLDLTSLDLAIK